NAEYRPREYLTEAEVEPLIEAARKRGRNSARDACAILLAYFADWESVLFQRLSASIGRFFYAVGRDSVVGPAVKRPSASKAQNARGYLDSGIDQPGIMHDLFRSYASLFPRRGSDGSVRRHQDVRARRRKRELFGGRPRAWKGAAGDQQAGCRDRRTSRCPASCAHLPQSQSDRGRARFLRIRCA